MLSARFYLDPRFREDDSWEAANKLFYRKPTNPVNRYQTLLKSKSSLGAFFRRKRSQLGVPEAITATAHKIAKIVYLMIKNKCEYQDIGEDYYEKKYKDNIINKMMKKAASLGYNLSPI